METRYISIILIVASALLPITFASGITPMGTQFHAILDKNNYQNLEKPSLSIFAKPNATINLLVLDSHGLQKLDKNITLENGTVTYSFDISSYSPGISHVIVNDGTDEIELDFAVGLSTTGPIITLNVLKDTYVQGDFITTIGTVGRNDTVQLSLIDPNNNVVTSIQTVSNDVGQYSTSALRIPTNAISGIWKITADHNISHTTLKIMVQSSASNGVIKSSGPVVITLESPLKQFKSGIAAKDVKCNGDLQLIFKFEDSSPACVTKQTAQKLVERWWGMYVPAVSELNIPILSHSINVQNTNFTLNYNISGNNKLLDANMDSQSKSLVLSMSASSNGTLSISIPRALLDSKSGYSNQDTQFIVLVDGQEIKYSETVSLITRTLSIPFEFGAEKIEIIATQQI